MVQQVNSWCDCVLNFLRPACVGQSIHLAAERGDLPALRRFLDSGVPIERFDPLEFTPLMRAANENQLEAVKFLRDRKANVDSRSRAGVTALLLAAQGGHTNIVVALLDSGANINAVPISGESALIKATRCGQVGCVKLLLERKADTGVISKSGHTAMDIARQENAEIESLLQFAATAAPPPAPPAPALRVESAIELESRTLADRADSKATASESFPPDKARAQCCLSSQRA